LSFDDGFLASCLQIAEIYERHHLAACFNVIATGHLSTFVSPDSAQVGIDKGDFEMWNRLQARGHEISPHTYRHANLAQMSFDEGRQLILDCLAVFDAELEGFRRDRAVFNFAYNRTTPELEEWLPGEVRAFRGGFAEHGLNPLPTKDTKVIRPTGQGPGNCEAHLDACLEALFAQQEGWLVYNTHGLDDEGWGPISAAYLDSLLGRLKRCGDVDILPAGAALARTI